MRLSVIIPTFNRKNTLSTTLLSLNNQTFKDFEVIVADDGSTDGTGEAVKALKVAYPLKHIRHENSGRSAARNMGLEIAGGDLILFIDDHIIVDKRLIEEHVKTHDRYKNSEIKVVRGHVGFIEHPEDAPKTTEYLHEAQIKTPHWEQEPFRVFITNNISVEKKALMSVFGFDEDFKEYGLQDADMGYRLKTAGFKYKINPNAVGYIFGVGLTFEQRCNRRRQVGRSSVLFYKKHPTLLTKINLSIHFITLIIQKLMSLFEKQLPYSKKMFYNFATGVAEGLVKYNEPKFRTMHSRFKGNKKNLLFVSHISDLSGAPISLGLLVKNLDKNKYHAVIAIPSSGPICAKYDELGIDYQFYKTNWLFTLFPSFKIWQIIADRQMDLVYLNTSASIWAAKPAIKYNIPVISHIREDLKGINNWLMRVKILLWSNAVILISKWMKKFIDSSKVTVVHNTIDISDFNDLEPNITKKEFALKGKTVLFVGTLEERKGIKYLIKAFNILKSWAPTFKLLIVGTTLPGQSGYMNKLKKLANNTNIIFAGPRRDIYNVMSACDLLVCPSISEPFGRVVIEAMACGKPVIASNVGGIPEIIDDGVTGKLIPPKDDEVLAHSIISLLENPEIAKTMGEAGRKKVEKQFTMESQIKHIERLLDEQLKT